MSAGPNPFEWLGAPDEIGETIELAKRDVIIRQGEHSDCLYLVPAPALTVWLDSKSGRARLGDKGVGDWVGELGLGLPGPATATVEAACDTRVVALSRETYLDRLERNDPMIGRLLTGICCDLARRIRSTSEARIERDAASIELVASLKAMQGVERRQVPVDWIPASAKGNTIRDTPASILDDLESAGVFATEGGQAARIAGALRADLEQLAPTLGLQEHSAGDVIVAEGAPADGLFLLLRGTVRVQAGAPSAWFHVDRELGPGSTFGQIAFFDDGTRSATCTASSDVRLAVIYPAAVKMLLDTGEQGSPMGLHFLDWCARQLITDARELTTQLGRRLIEAPPDGFLE